MAQTVKNLPAMRETQIRSLGREDPLVEGNGNLLQYSCLENPMGRGAWRATVHGVAESQTRLSDYSSTPLSSVLPPEQRPTGRLHTCFGLLETWHPAQCLEGSGCFRVPSDQRGRAGPCSP